MKNESGVKIIPGQKYGLLTTRALLPIKKRYESVQLCVCDCGRETLVIERNLLSGNTKSCGCWQRKKIADLATKHGMIRSQAYKTWLAMRSRVNNPKNHKYPRYGGRGIGICAHWDDFRNFYADMGERPTGMSIERIDNDGDYCPENCRWATSKEQANNTRRNRSLTHQGEIRTLTQWAEKLGINARTVSTRLRLGWSTEEALR